MSSQRSPKVENGGMNIEGNSIARVDPKRPEWLYGAQVQAGKTPSKRLHLLYREELKKLTPSMPGRYSGQQCAYAKGRARKRLLEEMSA